MALAVLKPVGTRQDLDESEVRRALALLADPAAGVELRFLFPGGAHSAVIPADDQDRAWRAVEQRAGATGIYYALNPVPAVLGHPAKNEDVLSRRWLLIDIDPIKPAVAKDESATDAEKELTDILAGEVRRWLASEGWCNPVVIDSGNGLHLLYRIDLPNDAHARALCMGLLRGLAERFGSFAAIIDRSVHNAARIAKLPGTWAKKGKDATARPHRICRILDVPNPVEITPAERLQGTLAQLQSATPQAKEVQAPPRGGDGASEVPAARPSGGLRPLRATSGKTPVERAKAYVAREPIAVSGQHGHDRTWHVANVLVNGFALTVEEAYEAIQDWNASCLPPWSGRELRHKLQDAQDKNTEERGKLLGLGGVRAPSISASAFVPPTDRIIVRASEITPRKVEWLWPGRIPLGKLTTFAGVGGLGKTFVLCDITARVTRGDAWPDAVDGECCEAAQVLFITGEDDPDDTLVPRLIELGADLSRIAFLKTEVQDKFSLADLETLDRAVREIGAGVRFVAIDPPTAYMGGVNDHKNAELRTLLTPLKSWAKRQNVALVFNTHVNKPQGAKVEAMMRVMGSVAWVNAVRAAHMFAKDPEDPERRLFCPMKLNIGKERKGLAYKIVPTQEERAKIEWLGEVETTADEALNQMSKSQRRDQAAGEWLIERFQERTEWPSDELFRAAKEAGMSRNAVFEAKSKLNLPKAKKVTYESGNTEWVWWVPPDWRPNEGPKALTIQNSGTLGRLAESSFP